MITFAKQIKRLISFLKENTRQKPILIKSSPSIRCGRESYHNGNFIVKGHGILEVGNFCAFGENITVILSNHDVSRTSMQYVFYRKFFGEKNFHKERITTKIENDVWVGDSVIILPGVKVGTGSVIGAGSIVTKDVEPYTIVAGNPAKLIKKRFNNDRILELLNSKWWDWDDETIRKNKSFFI